MKIIRAALAVAALAIAHPAVAAQYSAPRIRVPTSNTNVDQLCDVPFGSVTPVCSHQVNKTTGAVTVLPSALTGVDSSATTAQPTGTTTPASLAALHGDHPNVRFFGAANPSGHWNGDGLNDDAPALQAAIAYYCTLPRGGRIDYPAGDSLWLETVVQPCSQVQIIGRGAGTVGHDVGTLRRSASTHIVWGGAAGATMLSVRPNAATLTSAGYVYMTATTTGGTTTYAPTNSTQRLANVDVEGFQFDCNQIAGTGLDVRSARGSRFHNTGLSCSTSVMTMDTVPLDESNDIQQNWVWLEFNQIFGGTGYGLYCGGRTPPVLVYSDNSKQPHGGNCSNNIFEHVYGYVANGDGVHFAYSDHNKGFDFGFINGGGSHRGIVFEGSTANTNDVAYANHVELEAGAAVVAQGTDTSGIVGPALYNSIGQLDPADGGVFTTGAGTKSIYETDAGNFFGLRGFGTDTPAYALDSASESRVASLHLGNSSSDAFLYNDGANGFDLRVGPAGTYRYLTLSAAGALAVPSLALGTPLPVTSGGTGSNGGPWTIFSPVTFATGGSGVTVPVYRASYLQQGDLLRMAVSITLNYSSAPTKFDIPMPVGVAAATGPSACSAGDVTTAGPVYATSNAGPTVTVGWTGLPTPNSGDVIAVNCSIEIH